MRIWNLFNPKPTSPTPDGYGYVTFTAVDTRAKRLYLRENTGQVYYITLHVVEAVNSPIPPPMDNPEIP